MELRSFPVRSRPLLSRFKSNVRNYSRPSYVTMFIMPVCVLTRKRITNSLSAGLVLGQLSILLNKVACAVPRLDGYYFDMESVAQSESGADRRQSFQKRYWERRLFFVFQQKMFPEEFKVDGQITDESLKDYARAWGKDSIDKYQYDGIDIDFETAADHLGPLNTTPGLFKKFCEELSQYIGPKSGTGRLFLIDGNIDALDQGIAELCNYGVSQAYGCSSATMGYTSLTSRTASAERVGWKADQLIFTENFESMWKSGGILHTTLSGKQMMSLQGMADFAVNGTSCGFGAYHMEYEYGHSDMPYKYMRQAIQYANPAPHGDYSKNLVTLNEAGEYAFEIPVFPSGMSEGVQFSLTASLTGVPTADADIPLVVDNSLVTAYNNYYYTEYKTLDPALVSFSGPLHFVAGAQDSETPVIVGITDMTALGDEEYLVPVRVDFSKHSGFSANTDKEVCYLKLKTKQSRFVFCRFLEWSR